MRKTESFCYFTVIYPDIISTSKACGINIAADSNFCWEVQHSWKAAVIPWSGSLEQRLDKIKKIEADIY